LTAVDTAYRQIRTRARLLLSRFPIPDFYGDHPRAHDISQRIFKNDPLIAKVRAFITDTLENDFGHGMEHAVKVALDAGALTIIESDAAGFTEKTGDRRTILVQCASLLHDILRKKKHHAIHGAEYARKILPRFELDPDEIEDVCLAIRNHEAFQSTVETESPEGALVSDCLYDADKFRWGPDNFYHTLWDMVAFYHIPLTSFVERYPSGMKRMRQIRRSFRTGTGKKYGPQFIDIGLAVGEELYEFIQTQFGPFL